MSWYHNTRLLLGVSWRLSQKKKEWKKESQEYMRHYLDHFTKTDDGSITRGIIYKLTDYPLEALFAANILADLHDHELTDKERKLISLCGAVLALGDVFCDDTRLTEQQVELMLCEPHQAKARNMLERCFLEIYKDLLIELDDTQQVFFHEALMRGFEAEKESRKLIRGQLPKEEVFRIVRNKGGCSLLIYRSLIHAPLNDAETKALWQAGSFTQLVDDIFDIRWDLEKQVQTSATECQSFDELRKNLKESCTATGALFKQSGLQQNNCRKFMLIFQIFRLGTEAYLHMLEPLCEGRWQPEVLLSLSESHFKFKHFTLTNVLYVLPRAIGVRY